MFSSQRPELRLAGVDPSVELVDHGQAGGERRCPRLGQPDGRHQIEPRQLGEDPGIDPVGLGGERGNALDLGRIRDLDLPTPALEGVVDEACPGHRLDRAADLVAMAQDAGRQRPERPGVGADGSYLDRPAVLIEHVHIEPLARQIQSDVQHRWPPGAGCG